MIDKHSDMAGNSFKRMEEEQLRRNPEAPRSVGEGVDSSISFVKMVSNVLELYLPRVFDVLVTMSGGKVKHEKDGVPPSSINTNNTTNNTGPSQPPHELK